MAYPSHICLYSETVQEQPHIQLEELQERMMEGFSIRPLHLLRPLGRPLRKLEIARVEKEVDIVLL